MFVRLGGYSQQKTLTPPPTPPPPIPSSFNLPFFLVILVLKHNHIYHPVHASPPHHRLPLRYMSRLHEMFRSKPNDSPYSTSSCTSRLGASHNYRPPISAHIRP